MLVVVTAPSATSSSGSTEISKEDASMGDPSPANEDAVRVLVVDDEPDVAEVLAEILKLNGYQVRVAHDGLVAWDLVGEWLPHCVVLDVNLPGMDGAELSRRLRERHGDDLILVAVTGWGETDKRVSDAFGRVDHYLQKPVDLQMLSKVLPPVR
jgi:DNA-binding response OmpR family regulator